MFNEIFYSDAIIINLKQNTLKSRVDKLDKVIITRRIGIQKNSDKIHKICSILSDFNEMIVT